MDEASKFVDASIRDSYVSAKESQIGQLAKQAFDVQSQLVYQMTAVPVIGKILAAPAKIPVEIASSVNLLLEKDEEDDASLKLAEILFTQLQERRLASLPATSSISSGSEIISPSMPSVLQIRDLLTDENLMLRKALADESLRTSILPKVGTISAKFGAKLINRASARVEGKLQVMQDDVERNNGDLIVRTTAERGAEWGKTVASLIDPVEEREVVVK